MNDLETLVHQAQNGERQAVEALLEHQTQRVFAIACHFLEDRRDAEEAAQDALVRIFTRIRDVREPARFGAWCALITANLCRDRLRLKRLTVLPLETIDSVAGGEEPGLLAANRETRAQLVAALGRLTPALRLVFLLREVEGLATDEVAAALEIPAGTVKSRLFEARRQLRGLLSRNDEVPCHGG